MVLTIATTDGAVTKALMTPENALVLAEWLRDHAIMAAHIEDGARDLWETVLQDKKLERKRQASQ